MYNHEDKEAERSSKVARRLNILLFIVFFVFALIIFRLSYVQIVKGEEYYNNASKKSDKKIPIAALRGNIYDRNGELIVHSRGSSTAVFAEQDNMKKEQYLFLATQLEKILNIDKATLLKEMDTGWQLKNNQLIWVGRQTAKFLEKDLKHDLSDQEIAYLAEHRTQLQGIDVVIKPIREYSKKEIAPQAVGYVRPYNVAVGQQMNYYIDKKDTYLPDQVVGYGGIEYAYEQYLRGENGHRTYQVAADGSVLKQLDEIPPQQGDNVYLTIDDRIQLEARNFIHDFLPRLRASNWKQAAYARTAYAVAMEVKTGKVVSMISYPEYDPNIWVNPTLNAKDYAAISPYVNNGTISSAPWDASPLSGKAAELETGKHPSSIVPAGSSVKPATVMMGLGEQVITPYTGWSDPGAYKYGSGNDVVHNDENHNYGFLTPQLALEKSSNTFMAMVGDEIYKKHRKNSVNVLQSYFHAFGLGVKTGVDLPGEITGNEDFINMNDTYGPLAAMVQSAFGQQERYTAIQLAQYVTTIANNGKRLKPQLVDRIVDTHGKVVKSYQPTALSTLKEPDIYWQTIHEGMGLVTGPDGTASGTFAGFPYKVAAKTGTSDQDIYVQNPDTKNWYQYAQVANGVFISYAPIDNPKLAVVVIVPEGGYGAGSAGVIARNIYETYDKYVGLTTDKPYKPIPEPGPPAAK
ncbi:penicillin-binding transpeptidase domain-containing protein [Aneurinibacillus sp. Ricciae_BoGa-3]|uniref:peptidoglycan D,D-transpeptidase FtsI family protein n=1 Tax=Aneurinibacillus sp. Ricciae_BoGa-3 TaxID=3022697 RepID=UPI002340A83A|nr:penicillin-binding transpeptidase domain-containing protein [Aneurinibacillus sp. Ricciae_BoGa-3]WCK55961.1 penicillin-binding transpeptidase domain-containing protein [Aneurinibacillus sp. Ricciae_BoGa-3]